MVGWGLSALVPLFFFCGVGVVDDELAERERARGLSGGDQAVDGLSVTREGVGGRARPGRGQRDGARGGGVGPVQEGLPPVGSLVIVANQGGISGHPRRGRGQIRGPIPPAPRVGRGRECHGDLAAEHRHYVGLRGACGCNECGNVLIRVGNPFGPLVETGTVGVDDGSG